LLSILLQIVSFDLTIIGSAKALQSNGFKYHQCFGLFSPSSCVDILKVSPSNYLVFQGSVTMYLLLFGLLQWNAPYDWAEQWRLRLCRPMCAWQSLLLCAPWTIMYLTFGPEKLGSAYLIWYLIWY